MSIKPTKQQLLLWHNQAFDFLLDWRGKNKGFTFAPRIINKKDRLKEGYWFQGDDNYVFAGMSSHNDESNKTRQVGFVISTNAEGQMCCWLEIAFKTTNYESLRKLYLDFIKQEPEGFVTHDVGHYYEETKWFKYYPLDNELSENLQKFLEEDWARLYKMAMERGLLNDLLFPEKKFYKAVERIQNIRGFQRNALSRLQEEEPPILSKLSGNTNDYPHKEGEIDYEKKRQRQKYIGDMGEQFVMQCERERLHWAGYSWEEVMEKVKKMPDSAGYDIRSIGEDSLEKFIEVKTTVQGKEEDFYISNYEVTFSENNAGKYELWRLFKFVEERGNVGFYKIMGNMREKLQLSPMQYLARAK